MKQVQEATGLSKSTIYLFIRQGKFRKPIRLGQNSVGWLSSDIEEFINARVTASRPE